MNPAPASPPTPTPTQTDRPNSFARPGGQAPAATQERRHAPSRPTALLSRRAPDGGRAAIIAVWHAAGRGWLAADKQVRNHGAPARSWRREQMTEEEKKLATLPY